jgi:hypothetical protein
MPRITGSAAKAADRPMTEMYVPIPSNDSAAMKSNRTKNILRKP